MSYSLSQLDAIGDVDPVAEADVYLAYGRDLQAEEILKEAMRGNPDRLAIRTKLLEVYAKRRDTKGFELLATQLYALTKGEGDDWAKAQELGRRSTRRTRCTSRVARRSARSPATAAASIEPLGASTMPQSIMPSTRRASRPSASRFDARAGQPRARSGAGPRPRPRSAARCRSAASPLARDALQPEPSRRVSTWSRSRSTSNPSCADAAELRRAAPRRAPSRRSTSATSRCRHSRRATRRSTTTTRWRASSSWPKSSARSATWKARATCSKRWSPRPAAR